MSKTNRLTIAEQYNPIQHFYSPLLTVCHYMTRLIQPVVTSIKWKKVACNYVL